MGRLIDADEVLVKLWNKKYDDPNDAIEVAKIINASTVEAIPKAEYKARLKADMVAMLEDLDLKIDEMYEPQFSKEGMDGFYWAQVLFKDLVQEEINALKGEENGCNN